MRKLYTSEVKRLSIKKLDPNAEALRDIAFESTVIKKDALFYVNFAGVLISVEHNTKLLNRYEAEYYLRSCYKADPKTAHLASCVYKDSGATFSHEVTNEEFKQLIKSKKAERKAWRRAEKEQKRKGNI